MAVKLVATPGHNSKKIDFDAAAKLMKNEVLTLANAGSKIHGDQSAVWKRIEDLGVNKKAAKAVQAMIGQSPATVSDYLRTFVGLLAPLGLGVIRDMVDDMEGKAALAVPLIDAPIVDV